MEITSLQFKKVKRGKTLNSKGVSNKIVLNNYQRRSYRKEITKECKVLRSMRRMKRISQDQASFLCGYSRATIGHIENGRIELERERIKYIIDVYGYDYSDFSRNMEKAELRDKVIDRCIEIVESLEDAKLEVVRNLLESF